MNHQRAKDWTREQRFEALVPSAGFERVHNETISGLLLGTFTPSVHAHAGRTQQRGADRLQRSAPSSLPLLAAARAWR